MFQTSSDFSFVICNILLNLLHNYFFYLGRIACVSAPSVYQKLKELDSKDISACILEYDQRFSVYGTDYIFYDYNNPLNLPKNITAHSFDIVIADPPYLSEECIRKTSETIKYLTKGKILLCTGIAFLTFNTLLFFFFFWNGEAASPLWITIY